MKEIASICVGMDQQRQEKPATMEQMMKTDAPQTVKEFEMDLNVVVGIKLQQQFALKFVEMD